MSLRILQRSRHIVHLESQVMQAFAARGEENAEVGIVVERFDELDARRPRPKEGDPYAWEPLFATKRKAERLLEMQSRIVYRAHGPAEMVDHRHVSRRPSPPACEPRVDIPRRPRP